MDAAQLLDRLDNVFDRTPPLNTSLIPLPTTNATLANSFVSLLATLGPVALTGLHLLYLLPLPLPMKFCVVLVAHAVAAVLWPAWSQQ